MGNIIKYNGIVNLTTNGYVNSWNYLAGLAQSKMRSAGWGVTQFRLIDGGNFSFVLDVECGQNAEAITFNLEQTLLGTATLTGAVFSTADITSIDTLQINCGSTGGGGGNTGGGGTGGGGGNTGGGGTSTYTVRAGDTFSRIASRYGLSIAQLQALNPQVTNINLIHVGQVLNVSGTPTTPTIPVITNVNPNTGVPTVVNMPVISPNNPASTNNQSWFDRTFFTGAGALTGTAIGVLCVLGVVVITKNR